MSRRILVYLLQLLSWWPSLLIAGIYRSPLKPHSGGPPAGIPVSLSEPLELMPYAQLPASDLTAEFLREADKRDDVCVATQVSNELAAYGWVAYQTAPHVDGISVRLGRGRRSWASLQL